MKKVELHDVEEWTYSDYVVAGDYIFTSHIGGFIDEEGNRLNDLKSQTRRCIKNLKRVLSKEGVSLDNVVKMTVYLKDLDDFNDMKDVYREFFPDGFPARMTSTTDFIDSDCLIQIVATVYNPK